MSSPLKKTQKKTTKIIGSQPVSSEGTSQSISLEAPNADKAKEINKAAQASLRVQVASTVQEMANQFTQQQQVGVAPQTSAKNSNSIEKQEKEELNKEESDDTRKYVPSYIKFISKEKKNWTVHFLNKEKQQLGEAIFTEAALKPFLNKQKIPFSSLKKDAEFALTADLLDNIKNYGALGNDIAKMIETIKTKDVLEQDRQDRLKNTKSTKKGSQHQATNASQQEIINQLLHLIGQSKAPAKGHSSVKMTKIALDKGIDFIVGGKPRQITHLYVQNINNTKGNEIRCYVGTAEGAYQRVHTSLTGDKDSSAHTMVQTGEQVVIPGLTKNKIGTRVGFDSVQQAENGFANRPLGPRSIDQCEVSGSLRGQNISSLSEDSRKGCRLLADKFNELLDIIFRDIMTPGSRDITGISQGFKILDEEWSDGKITTPNTEILYENKKKESKPKDEEMISNQVDNNVIVCKTWEEASYMKFTKGQKIRITDNNPNISDRIFEFEQDYDSSLHEIIPDKLPLKWINKPI